MNKSILIKIKKNIIIINVIIIFIITLHYYFNKNRFDTLDVYLDYTFKDKILTDNHEILEKLTTSYFLNDIYFNKELYEINDLNTLMPIKLYINSDAKKLQFKFSIKNKKIFNIQFGNANEDLQEKNIEIINSFVNKILNKFHERLSVTLINKIEQLRKFGVSTTFEVYNDQKLNNILLKNEIFVLSNFLNTIKNGNKIIVFDKYEKKFRKNYFKTDEYILGVLAVLFLINILIKNINRVFR